MSMFDIAGRIRIRDDYDDKAMTAGETGGSDECRG